MEHFTQENYDHDPSAYDYEFVHHPSGYEVFGRVRQRLMPNRLRERVLDKFRTKDNVGYLQKLFSEHLQPGEVQDFIVGSVPDSVMTYERAEEILESDPLAQRGKLKSGMSVWDELRRLNTAYFYDRMNIANEFQERLDHGMASNEPYHYLMFMADSLYPVGASFLNTNPLWQTEENRFVPDARTVTSDTGDPIDKRTQTDRPYTIRDPEKRLARRVLDYMDRGDQSDLGKATGAYRPTDEDEKFSSGVTANSRRAETLPGRTMKQSALEIIKKLNDPYYDSGKASARPSPNGRSVEKFAGRRPIPRSGTRGKERFASGPFPQSELGVWTADAVNQRLERKINIDQDAVTRHPPQTWQDNFLVPDRYDGVDFVTEPSNALRYTDSTGRQRFQRPKTGEVYRRRFRRYTGFPRHNWVKRGDEYVERGGELDGMGVQFEAYPKGMDMTMVTNPYGLDGYMMGYSSVDGWNGGDDKLGAI